METTTEVLAIGAVAGAIAGLLILVRVHVLPGGRVWPRRRHEAALAVLLAASTGLLLVALERGTVAGAAGLVFLGVHAAARLAALLPGEGRLRLALVAVALVALAFGAADVTDAIEDSPGWSDGAGGVLRIASDAVGVTATLVLACHLVAAARERALGVAEGLFELAAIAWLVVAGAHLASLAAGGV